MSELHNEQQNTQFWALLIGIDQYEIHNDLDGCVNDIEAMKAFLINQLHVPEAPNIRVLTNEEATRANILAVFQEFLIQNDKIQQDDQILFHYSGHGASMVDPTNTEPNGYWESLVAHDSGCEGVYNIPDKTMSALLDRLAAKKGANITVILDCCHSGSGTRTLPDSNAPKIRLSEPDKRLPPPTLDQEIRARAEERGSGPSGWGMAKVPYTLLAACRDRELANEYRDHDGQQMVSYGALTFFLLKAFKGMQGRISYADIYEKISVQVNNYNPNQMPQLEGNRNRQVFGGLQIDRDPFITVRKVTGKQITVNAGLVHGLRREAEMKLYPAWVKTIATIKESTPLATVKVVEAAASSATAEVVEQTVDSEQLLHARALMTTQIYVGLRQRVALRHSPTVAYEERLEKLRTTILTAAPGGKPSRYLDLLADSQAPADLVVEAAEGKLWIYAGNGIDPLVEPEAIHETAEAVLNTFHSLEAIARYRRLMKLENEESGSQVAGKLRLRLRRYDPHRLPQEMDLIQPGDKGEEIALEFDANLAQNPYIVEVVNDSARILYTHLFIMNPDYSIKLLYPRVSGEVALDPGRSLYVGYQSPPELLDVYLPEGWDASRDRLKLIATTDPSDFSIFEQDGLKMPMPTRKATQRGKSALDSLLEETMCEAGSRFSRPQQTMPTEDWGTAALAYTVLRKATTASLADGETEVALGDGLRLQKPAAFQGQLSITTQGNGVRSADGDPDLKPPPGLAAHPERFQSLARVGNRGFGSSDLVIRLDIDEAVRTSVTAENWLKLTVDALENDVEELLPVAFDGEDYLLVGHAGDTPNEVTITQLPARLGEPTPRGFLRTVKLFVYKKLGRASSTIGLRRVELIDNQPIYSPIKRADFKAGDSVALLVHGFCADTQNMARILLPFLRDQVQRYDHFLTWDYESYGTRIEETATELAQRLRGECGFTTDDGITLHIFAHSMGSLVARALLELVKNTDFVDKLVMAGPPNAGTALANHVKFGLYLVTSAINFASVVPALDLFSTALNKLEQEGYGANELQVGSDFVKKLNSQSEPSRVPYLVLVGDNQIDETKRQRLNRLATKILDSTMDNIFNEPNDLVVGISQMKHVRNGDYPKLTIAPMICDHFHYFSVEEGRNAIRTFIQSEQTK